MFSCKTDNSLHGKIDGIWTSEKYDVEISGNSGFLKKLHYKQEINGIVPQIGDTVIKKLIKISSTKQEFFGIRFFITSETNEVAWDTATFVIIEKDTNLLMTSTIIGIDTIIFRK